jgi:transcriptional regulator with XRE-family HTH domain
VRRKALGLTQDGFGQKLDPPMTQADVSRLEAGEVQLPRPMRLRALADLLDVSPAELLELSGWNPNQFISDESGVFDGLTEKRQELISLVERDLTENDVWVLLRVAKAMANEKE